MSKFKIIKITIISSSLFLLACTHNIEKKHFADLHHHELVRAKAKRAGIFITQNKAVLQPNNQNNLKNKVSSKKDKHKFNTQQYIPHHHNHPAKTSNKSLSTSDLSEYVSRVGKRILIVTDNGDKQHYTFDVIDTASAYIRSKHSGEIEISTALLKRLTDEAELAAIISHRIAAIKHHNLYLNTSNPLEKANEIEKFSMIYMSRAGYDPKAAVGLQEIYLDRTAERHGEWLDSIYADARPSNDRLAKNKTIANNLPGGLQRGQERYNKHVQP